MSYKIALKMQNHSLVITSKFAIANGVRFSKRAELVRNSLSILNHSSILIETADILSPTSMISDLQLVL
jgi:hypothetical protein